LTGTGLEGLEAFAVLVHQRLRAADQPVRKKNLPFQWQSLGKLDDSCHGEEAIPPGMIAGMNLRRLISGAVLTRLAASQSRQILCVWTFERNYLLSANPAVMQDLTHQQHSEDSVLIKSNIC
jgi:hypothetical protein